MKEINIKIAIDEVSGKIATAKNVKGYNKNNISHQFEILGILENLCDLQKQNIRVLGKAEF